MNQRQLSISNYTYQLPDNRIARFPLEHRDDSRLLIWENNGITENIYRNITEYLPQESLLVFNTTKVIEARLIFKKPSGGELELFILDPADESGGIESALQQTGESFWKCLVGGASKWKHGFVPEIRIAPAEQDLILKAEIAERLSDSFLIRFSWTPETIMFGEILHLMGQVPLPPYLKRAPNPADQERYQTIYAKKQGSVAAPTAGLHFTPQIFNALQEKHIKPVYLTLHVGAGTFKPVKSSTMEGHEMHAEWIEVSIDTIKLFAQNHFPVYAVGTTSLRTLESLYWIGVKILNDPGISLSGLELSQWEVYDQLLPSTISVNIALTALSRWLSANNLQSLITKTHILIAPGYECKLINGLVTNFHQPQSTLLLLVAALIGDNWKTVYDYALENEFRFLSYGDGCLLKIK